MPTLIRRIVVDQFLDALGLLLGQETARAKRSARATARQRRQASGTVGRPPATDSLMADTKKFSELQLGEAQFDAAQGTQTKNLKGLIGQLTGIWQLDRHDWSPSRGSSPPLLFLQFLEQLSCRRNI